MRKAKWFSSVVLVIMFSVVAASGAFAGEKLYKLDTCWMPSHESFIPWYAKKMGWDKEVGLDMQMHYFDSGMAQMEALPSKNWVLGGTGGVPMVWGNLRYDAYMLGIANNESFANAIFARPDNPATKTKGYNAKFPNVLGSPESVKGKTILVTTVSSVHYAMALWLESLGLTEDDVVVKHMDQASAVAAFDSGIGDFVALWAPFSYTADEKGWTLVSDVDSTGAFLGLVLVGEKEFCDNNPKIVDKFMRMYFRGLDMLKEEGSSPRMVKLYKEFMADWAGLEFSDEMAKKDIDAHPVFDLVEQRDLFDTSKPESQAGEWQRRIAEFFASKDKLTTAELKKVSTSGYVTDKFLPAN